MFLSNTADVSRSSSGFGDVVVVVVLVLVCVLTNPSS